MEMTVITAKVNYETADFFQKYGQSMGVPQGEVLNRLLVNVSGGSADEAVELVMWYFDAMTSNNNTEQKLETLYIFTMLCMTLVDNVTVASVSRKDYSKIIPLKSSPDTTLKLAVVRETADVLNKGMSDYGLTESGMIEKTVADFLADDKMKPYRLVNYMISAARNLIRPQARMTVILTINVCVDYICELSDCVRESAIAKLQDMKSFALQNDDIAENIRLLRNTGFYREKLQ